MEVLLFMQIEEVMEVLHIALPHRLYPELLVVEVLEEWEVIEE
jgi:hypothetical protein